jgi:RNA polymerase sigma-70 factor, ECF subfamily
MEQRPGHGMNGPREMRRPKRAGTVLEKEDDVVANGRAFITQFLKAQRRIFAYILTLLPHQADAEDVLQQVSAIMWEKFDENDPPGDFTSWGCRIAYLEILHYRRSRQRQRVVFSEELLEHLAGAIEEDSTSLQLDERLEALDNCLEKLSRRDRQLLAERFKEGATPLSTALSVGRSVDAVYKAMARIRRDLYDCVTRTLAGGGRL